MFAVCMILLQIIFGDCEMQVLRPMGKAKIQPLFLNVYPNEEKTQFMIHGRFQGPLDMEAKSGSLAKVLDKTDFTLFEAIILFTNDTGANRNIILKSNSTSETLKMALNISPGSKQQTDFYGTNCEFEVKGSSDKAKYSAIVKNCGPEEDYTMYQYFKANLNLRDEIVRVTSFPESENLWNYVNVSENYKPEKTATAILNKDSMAEDGVKLKKIDFDLFALGNRPAQRRQICEALVWTYNLV
ncbi:uncharacterized protein LOC133199010 [Saccostrea echinata]|uniref:uncharacterized protein LOC133199010 n=1 Tax=Saccostrea echinata TaxID=191078 RepID=UPI002A841C11|nr:uncharacterized protein LOC133199010 [Saccostrea echinata]